IRGFATNRLIYTVDGVRMNTAIFRGGNIQNVINLDPFATEHTEVLFGPGSVIYGSDAIGGVMSFKTLEPVLNTTAETSVHGKAVMRYATANNERTGHVDINLGWKKWAALTSFSTWNFDHLRQGSHGPDDYLKPYYVQRQDSMDVVITQEDPLLQVPSAYSQINLMQKLRFRPNVHWNFIYGFHYSETTPYGRYDRHNRIRNDLPRYAEWNYGPQQWLMHNLEVTHLADNALYDRMSLRLAMQGFTESRIDRSLNRADRSTQTEWVDAYSANLDLLRQLGDRNTLYYGVAYVLNEVQSEGEVLDITTGKTAIGASRYPMSTWASYGVYLNNEFRWSEKLAIQAGIRYNRFQLDADFSNNLDFYPFGFSTAKLNNGALTGSLGAVIRPNENWLIRVNAGTAFRAPNVDDLGKIFDSEPGAVVIPNPDLEAEYAYNGDLGIAHHFGKAVRLELNGYYTLLQNALVRRAFTLNGQDSIPYDGELSQVQAIQNAAEARVYGLQVGLDVRLGRYFNFSTDLNFQDGEEELDDGTTSPSRHAAPFFGVSRLTYQARLFSLQFYAVYQGERSFEELAVDERGKDEIYAKDADGNNYAPAWYTLNVKASCPISGGFRINAGIENLTDQRYRPYSSGISGAGRNFVLSVQATF
ncbi:MAG: TonB-dependent receptor, partial [Phaeodactylibacter sp.]|nr:TonB-dependent receptor [Phaeodactylibacter sp.]